MGKEDQHYIPKFFLKSFRDADGNLHYLNTKRLNIGICSVDKICYKKYLYDIKRDFGKGDVFLLQHTIEDLLSKREDSYARLCRNIISICDNPNNKSALILDTKERELMVEFVMNLHFRNPDRFPDYVNDLYAKIRDTKLIKEFEDLKEKYPNEIITKIYDGSIEYCLVKETVLPVASGLLEYHKQNLLSQGSFCFAKSDDVEFVITDNIAGVSKDGFICIPISPQYAILISFDKSFRDGKQNRLCYFDKQTSQDVNKIMYQEAKEYVYGTLNALQQARALLKEE